MQVSEFKQQIRRKLMDAPDVHAPRWFRNELAKHTKAQTILFVDDFCGSQIAGATAGTLHMATNGPLLDELFSHLLWNRMHRSSYWVHGFDDVYAPSQNLRSSLKRIIAYAELSPSLHPGIISHLRAAECFCRQDFAMADVLLRDSPYPSYAFMSSFMLGSRTFRDSFGLLDAAQLSSAHEDLIFWENLESLEGLIGLADRPFVFSCDANYFEQFASHAVTTALAQVPDAKIVIAVVRAEDQVRGSESVANLRGITSEQTERVTVVHGSTSLELRPMTALGRFLIASEIHKRNNCGCFVFDIDIEFLEEMVVPILEVMDSNSLGVSFNMFGRAAFPWSKVAAAAVHVPKGIEGNFFYNVYISYVRQVLSTSNWWIDQNALYAAYSAFRAYFPTARIANTHRFLSTGIAMNTDPSVRKFKQAANRRMREME